MRVGLAILCILGVLFLLRVLSALLRECICFSRSRQTEHLATHRGSGQRGTLITMNAASVRKDRSGTDERIAL
jgi:hypothetical protein